MEPKLLFSAQNVYLKKNSFKKLTPDWGKKVILLVEYFTPCLTRKLANNDPFSAIVSLVI